MAQLKFYLEFQYSDGQGSGADEHDSLQAALTAFDMACATGKFNHLAVVRVQVSANGVEYGDRIMAEFVEPPVGSILDGTQGGSALTGRG